jgi:hypothetical protein
VLREQQPSTAGKKPMYEKEQTLDEMKEELWQAFEAQPKIM